MPKKSKAKHPIPRRALLNELSDDILGSIATFAGPCSLYEMFGIGNRLLTRKLSSPAAIPYYSNVNEYGNASYFSLSFLKLFRGLKSVVLDLSDFPSSDDYSLVSILSVLPDGIQEIDITNLDRLLDSEESKKRELNVGTVLLRSKLKSRFSLLHKFSLMTRGDSWTWDFPKIIAGLPPSLIDLGLMDIHSLHEHALKLPKYLQSLTFSNGELVGLSWIMNDLPNLTSLSASLVSSWELLEDDFSAEMVAMRHRNLKRLALSELETVTSDYLVQHPISDIQYPEGYLLEHFPFLEYLDLPALQDCGEKLKHLHNLNYCHAASPSVTHNLPSSLAVLRLGRSQFNGPLVLPQQLTTLELSLRLPDFTMLPRSLTELWLRAHIDVTPEQVLSLPPHLKLLAGAYPPFPNLEWKKTLPISLQCIVCDHVYVKTPNTNLSWQNSGWTNFQKAAETCDFEALESILHFLPKINKMIDPERRLTLDLDQPDDGRKIPLDCYDWLRKKGLLSKPSLVGGLSKDFCMSAIWQNRPTLLDWCSEKFTDRSWKLFGPAILEYIVGDNNGLGILDRIHPTEIPIDPRIGKSALTAAFLQHSYLIFPKLADMGYLIDLRKILASVFQYKGPKTYKPPYQHKRDASKFHLLSVGSPKCTMAKDIIGFLKTHGLSCEKGNAEDTSRMVDRDVPITSKTLTTLISELWVPGDLSSAVFDLLDFFHDTIGLDLNVLFPKLVPIQDEPVDETRFLEAIEWMVERDVSVKVPLKLTHKNKVYTFNIAHYAASRGFGSVLRYLIQLDFDFEELGGVSNESVLDLIVQHTLRKNITKAYTRHLTEQSQV